MTRLLAVVNQFPAPSETFIQRKLLGLRAAGFDVSVAAPELGAGVADLDLGAVPLAPWRHPRQALGGAGARSVLASTLAAGRPSRSGAGARRRALVAPIAAAGADIVHFEFSGIAVSYRDVLAELAPAKLAVSCRGAAEQIQPLLDPSRGPALAEVFERVDLVHCVSDDMARTVQALGADPARIVVNRPAVPVADFAGLREGRLDHDGPLRVASVGRLHWKKGFDDGLVAVAALHHGGRPVEYRIAGEGGERAKLAFLVHHHGLDGVVHLLGSRPQPEVRELLAWADVLLLPSLSEGISNAVLEAMAAGLPVVATRAGGMDEAIVDGSEGLLVDVGDAAAMAGALDALAADPDRRRALGAAAAARAAADFDLSRQIATFEDAYRRLLAA